MQVENSLFALLLSLLPGTRNWDSESMPAAARITAHLVLAWSHSFMTGWWRIAVKSEWPIS